MIDIIRAAVYQRVSIDDQWLSEGKRIEDGSLEVQKKRAIEHADTQSKLLNKKIRIDYFIEDAGKSAKDTNRQGFQKLCSLIEDDKIDLVITSELSRLNRDTYDYLTFRKLCELHKVVISYVGTTIREKDEMSYMFEVFTAVSAEIERKQTSKRVKNNVISRLKTDGKINGAESILGLDSCQKRKGHFVINDQEVKTLTALLEIYLESSGEADAIRTAHMRGLRDKGGSEFTKLRFKNILKNVEWRYAGKWYVKEASSDGLTVVNLDHGEVIEEGFRKCVLDRIKAQEKQNLKRGKHHHVYLLSAVLRSPHNQKFSGQIGHGNTQDYRYYYCKDLRQRINASELEGLIEKRVIKYFKDSSHFKKLITSGFSQRDVQVENLKKEIMTIRSDMKSLEKKIDGLIENMAIPTLSAPVIEGIISKLNSFEAQKGGLMAVIQTKEQMIGHFLSLKEVTTAEDKIEKYAREFKNLSRIQKRELLESIFEKIEVIDPYLIKLHLKRPPFKGDSHSVPKISCDSGRSGGTNRT